jgi:hypothetical protein
MLRDYSNVVRVLSSILRIFERFALNSSFAAITDESGLDPLAGCQAKEVVGEWQASTLTWMSQVPRSVSQRKCRSSQS